MSNIQEILLSFGVSLIITLILGPIVIPMLRKLKIGQSIREEGPKEHYKKQGTPTIGGVIMVIAIILSLAFTGNIKNMLFMIVSMVGFGAIGFLDDFIKVVLKRSLGLRAYQKIIGQFAIAILLSLYLYNYSEMGSKIIVPFLKNPLDLGIMFVPFITFIIVATVNSANLTDGLDGLASGVTAIIMVGFVAISLMFEVNNVGIFSAAVVGACIGFLKYNWNPAKVFMGDTGSMALGGAVVASALLLNMSLLIPIICGIYFVEALSVIIQVTSYKLRGKRIFLMSPLHHHYEQKGWSEKKVVYSFYSITLLLSIVSVILVR